MVSNSQYTTATVKSVDTVLQPFLLLTGCLEVEEHIRGYGMTFVMVTELQHTPCIENIVDLTTRGHAIAEDRVSGTEWQEGQANLKLPQGLWHISHEFRRKPVGT